MINYKLINPAVYDNVVEQILSNRGIEDIDHYLRTSDDDILDPLLLENVREGACALVRAIQENKRAHVVVDSDCDGFTSSSMLLNYLHALFPSYVEERVSYSLHPGKQHGIVFDELPDDLEFLIVPDAGSNDVAQAQELKERGITTLVLDHHNCDVENNAAIVINNQTCDYPNKSLSGVGIVYKFCSYLDSLLGIKRADDFLDLVATGITGDVMDLRNCETKRLIEKGLAQITNPFLKAMVEKQAYSLGDEITPIGIAFYVVPYVNGVIRSGSQEEKLLVFEAMLDYKGNESIPSTKRGCKGQFESRAEQAVRTATNVKKKQDQARNELSELLEETIAEKGLLNNKILAIQLDPDMVINKNLTGLIANQLMGKYQRPVMLLSKTENGWEGSCRGCNGSELEDFRQFLLDSGMVAFAQGHAQAFGSCVPDEKFADLVQYANEKLANITFEPCYKVDFIFQGGEFQGEDVVEIASLKSLWGQGIAEPYVAIENVRVSSDNITLMSADKHPTLKISLSNGVSLIKFKSSKEEYEALKSEHGCITLTIVGKCAKNVWNGIITPQILIDEYEVESKQEYYF